MIAILSNLALPKPDARLVYSGKARLREVKGSCEVLEFSYVSHVKAVQSGLRALRTGTNILSGSAVGAKDKHHCIVVLGNAMELISKSSGNYRHVICLEFGGLQKEEILS